MLLHYLYSRKHALLALVLLCAAHLAICLTSCNSYESQTTSDQVISYYQDKYGEWVDVADPHGLGSYNLFGFSYSGTEHIMKDGTSVVFLDHEGHFRDNHQAVEIETATHAFPANRFAVIPETLTSITTCSIGDEPGYETYEGKGACWATRYDGDIEAF